MARPARPWFRFYVEAFPDRKIRRLKPDQRWLWVAMLGAARESPTPGHLLIAPGVPMSRAELAEYADVSPSCVAKALPLMQSLGMLDLEGDDMVIPNFKARQFESDVSTDRVRKHRNKERSMERFGNTDRNAPESETEAEVQVQVSSQSQTDRIAADGLDRIKSITKGTEAHARKCAEFILAKAPADVRNPAAYVVAAINDDPDAFRFKRGNPKKTQECPTHAGQWADACAGCAADRKAAS